MVFDVTRLSTFEAVQMWKADLDNKVLLPNGKPIPAVLLANKVSVCPSPSPPLPLPLSPSPSPSPPPPPPPPHSLTIPFLQCDLASEGFLGNINQLDEYCREKGFHAWFETSAKENVGIEEAARSLVAKVSYEGLGACCHLLTYCMPACSGTLCPHSVSFLM